jgi:hypothetical protein
MAALGTVVAGDIANAILKHYARGKTLAQTIQDRPLLRFLNGGKKTFPGGNQYVSDPVQGAYMSDGTAQLGGGAFFQGYSEDQQLQFAQAQNILRAEYKWYEVHAGLVITWTELKKDGITITDNNKKSEHADMALTKLTDLLENRMDDFGESWARSINLMLWKDGSQDALQVPGILALILENPNVGVTGTLDRATYTWWRNLAFLAIASSEQNQTLTKTLRAKQRAVRRFGGKPSKFFSGSAFIDALEAELQAKGLYTQEGFTSEGKTDIGLANISLRGVGVFEYDPTLDDLGLTKYCFEFDSRRLKLRPMEGEDNKVLTPERPYQYMVFLNSMTWTGALQCVQLNAQAIFSIQ